MNKQTAQQLAYLIAAELVDNTEYVEEIVRREELVDDARNAEILHPGRSHRTIAQATREQRPVRHDSGRIAQQLTT
jgi:hypothetical protein